MEILGMNSAGEVVFRFGDRPEISLGESDLTELVAAIQRDYLPLWPTSPCDVCGTDAVVTIYGRDYCEGHAMSYGMREDETS
jgi:hypothetical protein